MALRLYRETRGDWPNTGKYAFIKRSFEPESDKDEEKNKAQ